MAADGAVSDRRLMSATEGYLPGRPVWTSIPVSESVLPHSEATPMSRLGENE